MQMPDGLSGDERLSFAFTCLEVALDGDARIVGLAGRGQQTTIQGLGAIDQSALESQVEPIL
jgi:hypothetical protein